MPLHYSADTTRGMILAPSSSSGRRVGYARDATAHRYATLLSTWPAASPMDRQPVGGDRRAVSRGRETTFSIAASDPSVNEKGTTQTLTR